MLFPHHCLTASPHHDFKHGRCNLRADRRGFDRFTDGPALAAGARRARVSRSHRVDQRRERAERRHRDGEAGDEGRRRGARGK